MAFNHISISSLLLQLIPLYSFLITCATTTRDSSSSSSSLSHRSSSSSHTSSKTSSSKYELPTLFLDNIEYKLYYTNVSIGSPPQDLQLRVDIIQPDTWVMDSEFFITCDQRYTSNKTNQSALNHANVNYTAAVANNCASQGLFNISNSTSLRYFNNNYQASNLSTDLMDISSDELNYIHIDGYEVQDHFHFQNQSIRLNNTNFVNVNYTNVLAGGLGLALDGIGNNFLQSLVNSEIINSSSYSLYLGRLYSQELQLNLGGLDTSKIKGDFVEFDFIPYIDSDGNINDNIPIVPLTGMSVTSGGSGLSAPVGDFIQTTPALLDSRTYYSYLPYDAVIDLLLQLNAFYSSDLNRWIVDCSLGNLAATVDFKFGNLTINILLSELMYTAYDDEDNMLTFHDSGASACFLNVLPEDDEGFVLLGTPFLRSIYLVVDNEGKKLAMAELFVDIYDGGQSLSEIFESESSVLLASKSSMNKKTTLTSTTTTKSSSFLPKVTTTSSSSKTRSDNSKDTSSSIKKASSSSEAEKEAQDDEEVKTNSSKLSSRNSITRTDSTTSNKIHTGQWGSTKTMIRSGNIPFASANNISSYDQLTLSQNTANATMTPSSGDVVIANGEIVFTTSANTRSSESSSSNSTDGSNGGSMSLGITTSSSPSTFLSSSNTTGGANHYYGSVASEMSGLMWLVMGFLLFV